MDPHFGVAAPLATTPSSDLLDGGASLGWDCVVAPVNSLAHTGLPGDPGTPEVGIVPKLPGRNDASYKMAPSLSDAIRRALQGKQVSPENITLHLNSLSSLPRYDHAFRHLWCFCHMQGADPLALSLEEVAGWLLRMAQHWPHEARNAYSALLLIPGWQQLRFSPLIKSCKAKWQSKGDKYPDFWDAQTILKKLFLAPLDWKDTKSVRDRLILVLRLLHLCRSVDLQRMYRRKSVSQGGLWVAIRRKGQVRARFERLIRLPWKGVSPHHLILHYVTLTAGSGSISGPLLLSHVPPFKPLSANSIGRITRQALSSLGVPTNVFGPHSTRGAGVKMYKALGFSSEIVCELGGWKNVNAFSTHYLRLGASESVGDTLTSWLVHKVPSWKSEEQDRSCSPETFGEAGRSDLDCESRKQDGTCLFTPACVLYLWVRFGRLVPYCFFAPLSRLKSRPERHRPQATVSFHDQQHAD